MARITRNELLKLVQAFCALAPEKRFCPTYLFRDYVTIYNNRVMTDSSKLATFSATKEGTIRITMEARIDKLILKKAGIKNNRVTFDCQPGFLEQGFQSLYVKYQKLWRQVKPIIDQEADDDEKHERLEKEILREVDSYGWKGNFYRELGRGAVSVNFDNTVSMELKHISRETMNAVLEVLGKPVVPKLVLKKILEDQGLSAEEWEALAEDEKQRLRQKTFESVYGAKN
jgi:hypothetical protein